MFDPKCYELAEYFLQDNGPATEAQKTDLAQAIQDAIELWLEEDKLFDYRLLMTENQLLEWLGKEDTSAYGECRGKLLEDLVEKGLVVVGPTPPGRSKDYARVSLTEAGRARLAKPEAPDEVV